ncbi:MAG TPA: hypothetical protein VKA16_06910 [Burkholderiales bacterium]|nr:hypothetical protein [Burkholderiales bacterium]
MSEPRRWSAVVVYAVAMALLEAAVVTYLRTLIGRIDPYQPSPLPVAQHLMRIELAREAATLAMLAAVAWLAGRERRSRFGYFVLAFGVWDLFYYVFLAPMSGWPRSPLDWDVLFLIPLPWWGPVLAPVSIAALMIAGGTLLSQFTRDGRAPWPRRWPLAAGAAGVLLALYTFMADALHAPQWSAQALGRVLPLAFDWWLFALALALMCAPLADLIVQLRRR